MRTYFMDSLHYINNYLNHSLKNLNIFEKKKKTNGKIVKKVSQIDTQK